jgi:HSP20 family protein
MYRRFRVPSIWREMEQLQREMNRLLESPFGRRSFIAPGFPAINIWTSEDSQLITAEMPGFNPDEIEINVSADTLTLSGERQSEDVAEGTRYHRRERDYGKFTRSVQLPFMVDTNKVDATFTDGILHIALSRAEADKPKKIAVKSG